MSHCEEKWNYMKKGREIQAMRGIKKKKAVHLAMFSSESSTFNRRNCPFPTYSAFALHRQSITQSKREKIQINTRSQRRTLSEYMSGKCATARWGVKSQTGWRMWEMLYGGLDGRRNEERGGGMKGWTRAWKSLAWGECVPGDCLPDFWLELCHLSLAEEVTAKEKVP